MRVILLMNNNEFREIVLNENDMNQQNIDYIINNLREAKSTNSTIHLCVQGNLQEDIHASDINKVIVEVDL